MRRKKKKAVNKRLNQRGGKKAKIKKTNKKLVKADTVIARIVTVSLRGTIPESKIGLTMRQFGLGKDEWLKLDEKRKEKKETDKQKKADKEARAKGGDRLGKK